MRSGGRTERFSSSVIDEENGLSHFQSLNHFASPLVLFFWTGGSCAADRKGLYNEGSLGREIEGCGMWWAASFALVGIVDTEEVDRISVKSMKTATPASSNGRRLFATS